MKTIVSRCYLNELIKYPACISQLFLNWHRNCLVYLVYFYSILLCSLIGGHYVWEKKIITSHVCDWHNYPWISGDERL